MIRPPRPSEVLSRFHTDKWGSPPDRHSYATDFYDHFLPHYRWCECVVEVGIGRGESLRAWAEYFPDAVVVGADCDRSRLVQEGRIRSFCVDAGDEHALRLFASEWAGRVSVVIYDASHRIEHQLLAVRVWRDALRPGGLLVVEDVASAADGRLLEAEGCRVESWRTDLRADNRIAWLLKDE